MTFVPASPPASSAAVVIGCSTGGLKALSILLAQLRDDLAAPVVVVIHRGPDDDGLLVQALARPSRLPVAEAVEREPVVPGIVHLAPSGYHLLIERDARFMLSTEPRVRFVRPSVDVLFDTAAACWRSGLLAVVLTGANDDGADGLVTVRRHRGRAIVQDPDTADAPQMPRAALERAGADDVLDLAGIARAINQRCP